MPMAPQLPMTGADGMTQPFNLIFEESCGGQCLPVGVSCHSHGLFSFRSLQVVIGVMDPLLELRLGVWPGSTSGTSPWFLHKMGAVQSVMEALLDRVKDFLADILHHLCITWFHSGCSFQLVYFIVHPSEFLPEWSVKPTSLMVGTSKLKYHLGKGCQWQPW